MLFAVPSGLGLETGDIRASVCMWLIPAVAMFCSSFLSNHIKARKDSSRKDFATLLLGIAAIEIVIAGLATQFTSKTESIVLITSFVFFYALAKEGVPRILYQVAVYRYFVEKDEYSQIAGKNQALSILASFFGTALAGWLVSSGNWRYSLVFDALTFVLLGLAILILGKDVAPETNAEVERIQRDIRPNIPHSLKFVLAAVPLLFGINALVWNYVPLLSNEFGVMDAAASITLISILRLPGMVSGFLLGKINRLVPPEALVLALPVGFLMSSMLFALLPSTATLCLLVLMQGFIAGVYWPSDFTLRSRLSHHSLIDFNTSVLRRLASFQFVACLMALAIYDPSTMAIKWVFPAMLVITCVAFAMTYFPIRSSLETSDAGLSSRSEKLD